MKLTKKQKAYNNADSNKELKINPAEEAENLTKNADDFELNDEQLEAAAGGVYIITPIRTPVGGEDGGGCTGGPRNL